MSIHILTTANIALIVLHLQLSLKQTALFDRAMSKASGKTIEVLIVNIIHFTLVSVRVSLNSEQWVSAMGNSISPYSRPQGLVFLVVLRTSLTTLDAPYGNSE